MAAIQTPGAYQIKRGPFHVSADRTVERVRGASVYATAALRRRFKQKGPRGNEARLLTSVTVRMLTPDWKTLVAHVAREMPDQHSAEHEPACQAIGSCLPGRHFVLMPGHAPSSPRTARADAVQRSAAPTSAIGHEQLHV